MKFALSLGLVLLSAGAACAAATPEVPAPVLSKPEAEKPSAVSSPAVEADKAAPEKGPAAPSKKDLTAPVPVKKTPGAIESDLARMQAELDALHSRGAGRDQFSLHGRLLFPADAFWADAMGGELTWRRWTSPVFGFAVAGGMQIWSLESADYVLNPSYNYNPSLDGSADMLPFGVSALFRRPSEKDAFRMVLELGVRYALVSSDAKMTFDYTDKKRNHMIVDTTVDFDDRPIGLASIELGGGIGRNFEWFLSGGYQMDFGSGGENWLYEEVGNDFSGAMAGAGLRWIP